MKISIPIIAILLTGCPPKTTDQVVEPGPSPSGSHAPYPADYYMDVLQDQEEAEAAKALDDATPKDQDPVDDEQ